MHWDHQWYSKSVGDPSAAAFVAKRPRCRWSSLRLPGSDSWAPAGVEPGPLLDHHQKATTSSGTLVSPSHLSPPPNSYKTCPKTSHLVHRGSPGECSWWKSLDLEIGSLPSFRSSHGIPTPVEPEAEDSSSCRRCGCLDLPGSHCCCFAHSHQSLVVPLRWTRVPSLPMSGWGCERWSKPGQPQPRCQRWGLEWPISRNLGTSSSLHSSPSSIQSPHHPRRHGPSGAHTKQLAYLPQFELEAEAKQRPSFSWSCCIQRSKEMAGNGLFGSEDFSQLGCPTWWRGLKSFSIFTSSRSKTIGTSNSLQPEVENASKLHAKKNYNLFVETPTRPSPFWNGSLSRLVP